MNTKLMFSCFFNSTSWSCVAASLIAFMAADKTTGQTGGVEKAASVAIAFRGTPQIDGNIDDVWKAATKIQVARVVPNMPAAAEPDLANAPQAQATARMLWDEQHVYVLIEVTDSKLLGNSPDPWQQDSVEVFVDENLARSTSYQDDDSHYRVNFEGTFTAGQGHGEKYFRSETRRTDTGYLVECAVQLKTIKLSVGSQVGLEFQVNDNRDGTTRGAIAKWASPDNEIVERHQQIWHAYPSRRGRRCDKCWLCERNN